jgi:hypothetical protein
LSSDGGIEFGQSASEIVTCAGTPINLMVTPYSSFANASDFGTHYLKSIKVSGITSACAGIDFKLRAYDASGQNPLAIFDSNNTVAVVNVVTASNYEVGTGAYGTTVSDAAGGFTVTFTSPVAISTSVAKLTIETGPQYLVNQTIPCGNAGTFTVVNNVVTSSSANCAGSLNIPLGVNSIVANAFENRPISGTVSLPNGLVTIGSNAFYGTGSFSTVIPSSVTSMNSAFYRSNVSSVTFQSPSSLTSLTSNTFRSNGGGTLSITIPDEVTSLGDRVFGDQGLTASPFTSTSKLVNMGTMTFYTARFTTFVIPSEVKTIGADVFFSAPQLKRVTFPSGITSITAGAFSGVPALNCVINPGNNAVVAGFTFPSNPKKVTNVSDCDPL